MIYELDAQEREAVRAECRTRISAGHFDSFTVVVSISNIIHGDNAYARTGRSDEADDDDPGTWIDDTGHDVTENPFVQLTCLPCCTLPQDSPSSPCGETDTLQSVTWSAQCPPAAKLMHTPAVAWHKIASTGFATGKMITVLSAAEMTSSIHR